MQYSDCKLIFIKSAVEDELFTIYGDGFQTRDFTFVDDICIENIRVALSNKANNMILTVGKCKMASILEDVNYIVSYYSNVIINYYKDEYPMSVIIFNHISVNFSIEYSVDTLALYTSKS